VREVVRHALACLGAHTSTTYQKGGNWERKTLSANEVKEVFIYERVGFPWVCDVPRGDSTQGAL
jgi:hypothetical protein